MKIAIVGATGEVGRMMLTCLQEYKVPVNDLSLFASSRSAGEQLFYEDRPITVRELDENSLTEPYDYVLFSAGGSVAKSFAPIAAQAGSVVIDNSSAFRMEPEIPLVVPEINGDLLEAYKGIVANPNCSTIQMVLPLAVLDKLFGLNKVVVSTYQSVSGSGHQGILTLEKQRAGNTDNGIYPQIIDLNVIPQIGVILSSTATAKVYMRSLTCQWIWPWQPKRLQKASQSSTMKTATSPRGNWGHRTTAMSAACATAWMSVR